MTSTGALAPAAIGSIGGPGTSLNHRGGCGGGVTPLAVRPIIVGCGVAFERITIDPERMGGVPCIRDLRVTVGMVLGQLAGGKTIEELLGRLPLLGPRRRAGRL